MVTLHIDSKKLLIGCVNSHIHRVTTPLSLSGVPGIPVRAVRHRGQVPELAALAHVAAAQGHLHQGPARRAHARALRRRARLQAALQVGGQGEEGELPRDQ